MIIRDPIEFPKPSSGWVSFWRWIAAGAQDVYLLATSAARDARNTSELADVVRGQTGLEMWVISGEMEALFSYLGAVSALHHPGETGVIDIGGGSAEVVLGQGGEIIL